MNMKLISLIFGLVILTGCVAYVGDPVPYYGPYYGPPVYYYGRPPVIFYGPVPYRHH